MKNNLSYYNPTNIEVLVNKKHELPNNYIPTDLIIPDIPFTFNDFAQKKLLRKQAAYAIELLFKSAKNNSINLYGISGYRSFERQAEIFNNNVKKCGSINANKYSAKPGQSEHQTGLAMDISCESINFSLIESFGQKKEGIWIKQNAHLFGFIIRYPKGKEHITGYQYEPWHIRFLGKELASYLTKNNLTYEEYLGVL